MSRPDPKAARLRLLEAEAAQRRVQQALAGLPAPSLENSPEAQAVQRARQALGDAQAAAMVGEAASGDVEAAQQQLRAAEKAFDKVRQAHEEAAAQAAVLSAGLTRRLAQAEAAHTAAAQAFEAEVLAWAEAQLLAADVQYVKHGQAAAAAAARVQALHAMLGERGVRLPGANVGRREIDLPPIGPESLRATMDANPHLQHGGNPWEAQLLPRPAPGAAAAALTAELDGVAGVSGDAPRGGVLAALSRAVRVVAG